MAAGAEHDKAARVAVVEFQAQRGRELHAFARRLGLSREAADDAVQESLLRLWKALDAGQQVNQIDAWTFRTLYRLCMDQHRWRRRLNALLDRLHLRARTEPRLSAADRLSVWEAVDQLPPRQRAAVYLRYRADLDYQSIAVVLSINAVSARSHVSRAIDRLRDLLAKEDFQ